jgi:SpoVK/Ycf46/Vps4 family AAA+-type ATPase
MIVAATNAFDVLDSALFRRFDDVLYFDLPSPAERAQLIANRLNGFMPADLKSEKVVAEAESLSHAEIARACDDAIKQVLLTKKKKVSRQLLSSMLEHRRSIYSKKRG